jgi:hypothetical protein
VLETTTSTKEAASDYRTHRSLQEFTSAQKGSRRPVRRDFHYYESAFCDGGHIKPILIEHSDLFVDFTKPVSWVDSPQ